MKSKKKNAIVNIECLEDETPVQAATLLWNSDGWCVRYPDKDGNAKRIKLTATGYADAVNEANRKLPAKVEWVIA